MRIYIKKLKLYVTLLREDVIDTIDNIDDGEKPLKSPLIRHSVNVVNVLVSIDSIDNEENFLEKIGLVNGCQCHYFLCIDA